MFIKKLFRSVLYIFKRIPQEIFVFLITLAYRLPSLGYDYINNDAFLWKQRGYEFGSAITSFEFARTAVTYHPGVPLLWCQFISIKIYSILIKLGFYNDLDPRNEFLVNNQIQTITVVVLTSILITIAYHKLKKIIGNKLALLTILIVSLEPFYIALGRALHTDVMLSLFMFISLMYFYEYLEIIKDDGKKHLFTTDAFFAGVFAGLAFLTKSSALYLFPFFGLITAIYFLKYRKLQYIHKVLIVSAISVATFFVVWPAMWVQPINSINLYLFKGVEQIAIEEGHQHYWFGHMTDNPGPLFYPIVLVGRYSMVLIIALLGAIYLLIINRAKVFKDKNINFYLVLFLYALFYFLMITLVSKKLDRYSLPIVFTLGVFASWVYSEFLKKKILTGAIMGFIVMRALLFYGLHPNYLAYYSPLIGGVENGPQIIEPMWTVGYDKIAKYFNDKQDSSGKLIKVAISDYDYLRPFAKFEVLNITVDKERNQAEYLIIPAYRRDRNSYYRSLYNEVSPADVIKVAGVDYYNIYKITPTIQK